MKIDFLQASQLNFPTVSRHLRQVGIVGLAIANLILSSVSHACSCRFEEQNGFIHGSGQLPSNARGVLYQVPRLQGMLSYEPAFLVVDTLPPRFDANSFVIKQKGSRTSLAVVIEPVALHDFIDAEHPVYFTDDKALGHCIATRSPANCEAVQVDVSKENWRQALIASGRIRDISDIAASSGKLFRIRPAVGFVEGESYDIERKTISAIASSKEESSPIRGDRVGAKVTIDIGPALDLRNPGQFAVKGLGKLQRESISIAAGGSCGESYFGTSQLVRYELPAQFEPYRGVMAYFTQVKFAAPPNQVSEYQTWIHRPNYCSSIPLGGSSVGVSQEKVYRLCGMDQGNTQTSEPTYVRGKVVFYEMEDRFFETSELVVEFNEPTLGPCSALGTFMSAIRSNEEEAIATQTCSIAQLARQTAEAELDATLRLLASQAQSKHVRTRQCAQSGAISLYQRREYAVPESPQDKALGRQVDQLLAAKHLNSEFEIASALLNGLDLAIANDSKENLRYDASSFKELVDAFWKSRSPVKLSKGEKQKLLQQVFGIIERIHLRGDRNYDLYAAVGAVVTKLGVDAQAYIPQLLAMFGAPSKERNLVLPALASIAPDDTRVFDAVVRSYKYDPYSVDARILVSIRNSNKSVVLELIQNEIQESNGESTSAIQALGLMGSDAVSSKPFLYQLATDTKSESTREYALLALVNIDQYDPKIATELLQALESQLTRLRQDPNSYERQMRSDVYIEAFAKLGSKARIALPTFNKMMDGRITVLQKYALRQAFQSMQLEPSELKALLAKLERVPTEN